VFSWNEIPGKDDEKLRKFITQRYNIDWAKTAKIEKPDESIKVTDGDNFLSLTLCDEDNIVYLEIDDGRTEDFIVKSENHEPKIFGCWLIFKFLAYLLKTTAVNEFLWNLCEEKQCKHMNCKDDCKDRDKIWKKDVKNEKRFMRFTDCISAEEMYNQHRKYEVNHGHEVGVHVFFRNLAFISLIDIVFLFGIGHALPGFYYLFISFISFVIFSAFVSYYYRLGFLCDAYISSKKNELY
jgi:hypothetical protein